MQRGVVSVGGVVRDERFEQVRHVVRELLDRAGDQRLVAQFPAPENREQQFRFRREVMEQAWLRQACPIGDRRQ